MVNHDLELDLAEGLENSQEKIDALNEFAWRARESEPQHGVSLSQKAYDLSRMQTPVYIQGLAQSSRNLASLHFHTSEYHYSLQKAFEALDLFRQLNQPENEGLMLLIIGQIYEALADYSEALSYTFDALERSESLNDIAGSARNLTRIGEIYHQLGKYQPELETYTKALQYYQELKEDHGMAVIFNRMARSYSALGEYTNAIIYAQNSLLLAQNLRADLLETEIHCTLGEVYGQLQSHEQSLLHFTQAIQRADRLAYRQLALEAKLGLGQLYCGREEWDAAVDILNDAVALASESESRRIVFLCHKTLAYAYEALGDYKQALHHQQRFHQTEKLVFNENTERQFNNLRVIHDTERARKEAEIYELQNRQLAYEVSQRKRAQQAAEEANYTLALRIEELSTLNLIAQSLATTAHLDQSISDVGQTSMFLSQSNSVVVGIIDRGKKRISMMYQHGICIDEGRTGDFVSFDQEPLWAKAVHTKLTVEQSEETTKMKSAIYGTHCNSDPDLFYRLCVPLRTREEVIGVLGLTRHKEKGPFSTDTIQLLETVAGLVGVALDNARLFESEQNQRVLTEARNEELDAFARTVAHDLKNPLSALMSSAEFLQNYHHVIDVDRLQEIFRIMHSSSVKATSIVEELLLLAGVRKQQAQLSTLDMGHIVEQAKQRFEMMLNERDGEWVEAESWPVAVGYGPWVEEVWANYISNALKYGGKPYRIEVGATRANGDGMTRFWIKDNGAGIPESAAGQLFSEFNRLQKDKIEGHGLGLSIVKRIVEKLNGTVGFESPPDGGSIFYFTLPVAG